jgi:hypothetical protein
MKYEITIMPKRNCKIVVISISMNLGFLFWVRLIKYCKGTNMYVITKEESEPSTQAVVYSFNEILIINNNDYVHIYTYIYR